MVVQKVKNNEGSYDKRDCGQVVKAKDYVQEFANWN